MNELTSTFALRGQGLIALGLPEVALKTTQASAAWFDDMYGLSGNRCRPVHFTNSRRKCGGRR